MIYLRRVLPFFLSPLFVFGALVILGLISRRRWMALLAVAGLWLIATPVVSDRLVRAVEEHSVRQDAARMPVAGAVVVLGGMLTDSPGVDGVVAEWRDPDRYFAGLALYQAARAPRLIFTRGKLPWSASEESEGEVLRRYALRSGVAASAILLTKEVANTREEAQAVRALLGPALREVILVTSAFHMPRARQIFEREGLRVHPYPVDFKVSIRQTTMMDFLPDANALRWADVAIREWIGQLYYRWASWS